MYCFQRDCQIFLGTTYQNGDKYTKLPHNIPNGLNIPIGLKIYQHLPFQVPPTFTQIGIFGLKIYHLATLVFSISQFRLNFTVSSPPHFLMLWSRVARWFILKPKIPIWVNFRGP
jgi:hypothetical protein